MEPRRAPTITLPLLGAGGEPVAFRATVGSHGLAWLPPNDIVADERALTTTLLLADGGARRVALREEPAGTLAIWGGCRTCAFDEASRGDNGRGSRHVRPR